MEEDFQHQRKVTFLKLLSKKVKKSRLLIPEQPPKWYIVTTIVLFNCFLSVAQNFVPMAGFQSARTFMIDGGIFHDYCNVTVPKNTTCPQQIRRYDIMFNVAVLSHNFFLIITGLLTDRYLGPKIMQAFAGVMTLLGFGLFAAASFIPGKAVWNDKTPSGQFVVFCISYVLMVLAGGAGIQVTLHIANRFVYPYAYSSLHEGEKEERCCGRKWWARKLSDWGPKIYLSFILTAEDSGAVVFLVFQKVSAAVAVVRWEYLVLGWGAFICVVCLINTYFQPWGGYISPKKSKKKEESPHFLLGALCIFVYCLFAIIGLIDTYFFFTTFPEQILKMGGTEEQKNSIVTVFGIFMACAGLVATIVMGLLMANTVKIPLRRRGMMEYFPVKIPLGFLFILLLTVVFTVCENIPCVNLQYLTILSFVMCRACFFSMWVQYPGEYFPNIMPSVVGIVGSLAGIANLLNIILFPILRAKFAYQKSSKYYLIMNLILGCSFSLILIIAMFVTLAYDYVKWKKSRPDGYQKIEGVVVN